MKTVFFALLCTPLFTSLVNGAITSPPEPSLRKTAAAWMGFMLMFLFFSIVVTISLMTSKRGHQD
jgi:cytochrome b561